MNTKDAIELTYAVKVFLEAVDDGIISIDTRSPTTKKFVSDMRDALANHKKHASLDVARALPNYEAKQASALRKELIRIRDSLSSESPSTNALILTQAISFVHLSAMEMWRVDVSKDDQP